MKRELVTSSTIRAIGYDKDRRVLEIEFLTGSVYQYFDVPEAVFTEILRASSAGQYLNANIRGQYRYGRV